MFPSDFESPIAFIIANAWAAAVVPMLRIFFRERLWVEQLWVAKPSGLELTPAAKNILDCVLVMVSLYILALPHGAKIEDAAMPLSFAGLVLLLFIMRRIDLRGSMK